MLFWSFFFLFIAFATAAPTSTSSTIPATSTPDSVSRNFTTSTLHRPSHSNHPIPHSTHAASIQIISRPTLPTHSKFINRPRPSGVSRSRPGPPSGGQKPIAVVFEVIGGLVGLAMLFGVLRCCYNYHKTPRRDRIAEIVHRYNLQQELEEMERNPAVIRRPSLREPAPPYFPRPPSYDQLPPGPPTRISALSGTVYASILTYSPPPSPPMSQRTPLPSAVAENHPPDLIPPAPSG